MGVILADKSVVRAPVALLPTASAQDVVYHSGHPWNTTLWQLVRFGIVGVLNTTIDIVTLNILLWRFPTHNANLLLVYNTIAYTLGALNSFALNKYWTFGR